MKFYDKEKTFLELVYDYQGNLDKAFEVFEENWSEAKDTRTLSEAMGISLADYEKFELDELSLQDLLKKYGKAVASY